MNWTHCGTHWIESECPFKVLCCTLQIRDSAKFTSSILQSTDVFDSIFQQQKCSEDVSCAFGHPMTTMSHRSRSQCDVSYVHGENGVHVLSWKTSVMTDERSEQTSSLVEQCLTSKYVPPPVYCADGVIASVMARIPLSICTSVRGWLALSIRMSNLCERKVRLSNIQ